MAIIQTPSIASVVEDQTPQLGGDLDCQDYQITDVGLLQWYDDTLPFQSSVLFGNTLYFTPTVNTSAYYLFRGAGANKNLRHAVLSSEIITYIGSDQSLHTYRGQNASLRYRWRAGAGSNVNAELGADYFELKDGANPFTQTIFNTYTDASNFEALSIGWDTNVATISTTAAGTGTRRELKVGAIADGNYARFQASGTSIWRGYAGGVEVFKVSAGSFELSKSITVGTDSSLSLGSSTKRWSNTYTDSITIGNGVDAILTADADNELALRNGANAQKMSVYNTWTDGANFERLELKFDSDRATIGPDAAGTGSQREMQVSADAGNPNKTCLRLRDSSSDIVFRVGSSQAYLLDPSAFQPQGAAARTLGTTSQRWATTYTDGIATDVETFTAASDTLDAKNNVALCDCTSNNITINLPAASTASGLQYHIKKIDASANTVTIDGNGSETIDGALTQVISTQYNSITVVSDGSNWFII